jgi:lysophospholipase L1-like esterase
MRVNSGDCVVFAGDSITDAGRTLGMGESSHGLLGEGYVHDTVTLLLTAEPMLGVRWHNSGIGGFTSRGLAAGWDDLVLAHEPDLVTLLVGVNDCNFRLIEHEAGVDVEEYAEHLEDVVGRTLSAGAQMILLEPFYLRLPDTADDGERRTRKALAAYQAEMRDCAARHGLPFVALQRHFDEQLRHRPASDLCPEPVHPNRWGHLLIAHHLTGEMSLA